MNHEGLLPSIQVIQTNLRAHLEIFANLALGYMNFGKDLDTFLSLGVSFHLRKTPKIHTVVWHAYPPHWIKVNSYGLSKDNPDPATYGAVFRSYEEEKELVERSSEAYWTTLAPNVEDYNSSTARLIATGSWKLIRGFCGGDVTADRLRWGNEFLKRRMRPG
ncbi:hypothetical protein LWI28_001447 [Acer negundo]|uniref:Uncharacterized protein n=1 Tax=Acer negundo TaxID=4023 RepID=A0AAD5IPP0_ACENE|nr:hypothetical protein LWI28_001447 [Acer negundo]